MMNIVLVRHGEAETSAAGGDAARCLTERGRNDAAALGQLLGRGHLGALGVFTSPFKRARETGELIAGTAGAAAPEVVDELEPGATGEMLLEWLRTGETTGPGPDSVVVVAHAPDVSEMLVHMLNGGAAPWMYGFPPGASAVLRFASWPARPGRGRLTLFVVPDGARLLA